MVRQGGGELISSQAPEDLAPVLEDFSAAAPPSWSQMLRAAAARLGS